MTSSLQDVYTAFFDRVEKDRDFFRYFEVEEEMAMKLAEERAKTFLKEACSYIRRHIPLGFELKIVQGEDAQDRFAEEITDDEVELLADVFSKDRLTGEEKYISTTLPEESDE